MKLEDLEFLVEPPDMCLGLEPDMFVKAKERDSFAQLDIGKAYFDAPQTKDNLRNAFKWIDMAAQQQNSEAQFRLGDLYAFGQGVEQDEFTAYDWYLRSAIQGYPKALTRLHNLYHIETSMYCRGKRDAGEDEWATAEFKKKNKIRELNEYRIEQMEPELTKIKAYFSALLNTCRNQIKEDNQDKKDAYSTQGFLYQHGYGIRKITSRAIEFYKLAADQGCIYAAYNLGYIYHQNYNWKWNYQEAFKWYTLAANNGSSSAQNGLATDINYSEALRWYKEAAEGRNINAMISLASIYRKGDIVEQDYTKVLEWYRKAIKEGSTVAQNSLESLFHNKKHSTTENTPLTSENLQKVYSKKGLVSKLGSDISNIPESADLEKIKQLATYCKRADVHAMFDIGKRYSKGNGLPQDKHIAFKWIKNAAKTRLNEARRTVAQMYKDGDGIDQDYHKASIWYMRAAKAGDDKARYELGLMYYHGLGVRKDPLEASKWFTFAADNNNSDAQCQLGVLRKRGEGLIQDTAEAVKLYHDAVKQKNPLAIYKLGQMYEVGGGLENNVELSMKLFGIAARLGSLDAQLELAKIYGERKNQYYDTKASFKYYQMAADQGSTHAKYKMAIMYLDGKGTRQDLIQAYDLFKECSNLGYSNARNIFNIPIDYSKNYDIDYRKVVAMFVTVCKNEVDSLECNVGHLYSQDFIFSHNGFSVTFTADSLLKREWYERAANKGNSMALYELGISYETKSEEAKIQDLSKAVDYFQRSYKVGNIDATYKLATMYLHDYGVSQDLRKAFNLLHEASGMAHKEAQKILKGDGQDKHKAIKKMLEISAESGHVLSQYKLGMWSSDTTSSYYNTKDAIKWLGMWSSDTTSSYYNTKDAIKWLEMASCGGFINAHYKLALLLESDNPSDKEQQKIISLYRMAADKGHKQALFRLAQLYQNGTKRNYVEAFRLYTLAAQQRYQPAQLATWVSSEPIWEGKKSQLPDNLMPGELEYPSCLRMWETVADQGNVELQYSLGVMYENVGTDSSLSEAARWYSRAAKSSHSLATYHLGRLHETGRGVYQDYSKATKYYKRARDLGNSDALYQLGFIYQHGKGTRPNTNKAIDFYTQAAEKGNTMAQFTLGQLSEQGILLSKSILEAVKWYSMASSQGNENAQRWLQYNYDEPYTVDSFYNGHFHNLSQIVEINSKKDRHHNNELLGEVNYKLGLMYFYGRGIQQDHKKALKCFRKSTLCSNDKARLFSEINYEDISTSLTEEYLKKVDMFETATDQLDLEDIYELGLIYYHGVKSISEDNGTKETRIIIDSNRAISSKYFRMIVKGQFSDDELYTSSSFYLGMMHFVDIEHKNDTERAHYYLTNAFNGGCSDAKALLNYINKEETDKAAIFKQVFKWYKDNYDTCRAKMAYNLGFMYYEGLGTGQDYTEAIHLFKYAASRNHTGAQLKLGVLYEKGHGTIQNWTKSREWFTKAANQNIAIAHYNLGSIYFGGKGVEVNYQLAFQYFQAAADQGYAGAQAQLGVLYENGYGTDQDWTKAREWYTKAADQNDIVASRNLGRIYRNGEGAEVNYQKAFQYYQVAADQGDADAQFSLGVLYEDGDGTDQDRTKAMEWYTKAANQNDCDANYNLGVIYEYGQGVEVNYQKAFQYYQIAADQGDAGFQEKLGFLYKIGRGTDQDWAKAREWYTKAANQNNVAANSKLGDIYYYGDGVKVNYQLAFQYYQTAADQGHATAQMQLADMYHRGLGVTKDSGKAIQLCSSIPIKNGDVWCILGEIYHSADTQFQDFSKALKCYELTEGTNKSHSLRGLGLLYEHGDGVEKDYKKALEYYLLSQDEGNKGAYYNIALLYHYGKGVAQDFSASFEFFERVLEGGCEEGDRHVLVESDSESNSLAHQQKKNYSKVSERIIYGEAHFYLGIMNEKGQGTSQDQEKALYHFKCSYSYGIDRAKEFLEI